MIKTFRFTETVKFFSKLTGPGTYQGRKPEF